MRDGVGPDERQARVIEALENRSPKLAGMYRTALEMLATTASPGCENARISKICQMLLYPAGLCLYCGEYADTRDHLLPVTYTGRAVRRQVLTVPAYRQCNSFIGDAAAPRR